MKMDKRDYLKEAKAILKNSYCANCACSLLLLSTNQSKQFTDNLPYSPASSSETGDPECSNQVTILEALSLVFQLHLKSQNMTVSIDKDLSFCHTCVLALCHLYYAYKDFTDLSKAMSAFSEIRKVSEALATFPIADPGIPNFDDVPMQIPLPITDNDDGTGDDLNVDVNECIIPGYVPSPMGTSLIAVEDWDREPHIGETSSPLLLPTHFTEITNDLNSKDELMNRQRKSVLCSDIITQQNSQYQHQHRIMISESELSEINIPQENCTQTLPDNTPENSDYNGPTESEPDPDSDSMDKVSNDSLPFSIICNSPQKETRTHSTKEEECQSNICVEELHANLEDVKGSPLGLRNEGGLERSETKICMDEPLEEEKYLSNINSANMSTENQEIGDHDFKSAQTETERSLFNSSISSTSAKSSEYTSKSEENNNIGTVTNKISDLVTVNDFLSIAHPSMAPQVSQTTTSSANYSARDSVPTPEIASQGNQRTAPMEKPNEAENITQIKSTFFGPQNITYHNPNVPPHTLQQSTTKTPNHNFIQMPIKNSRITFPTPNCTTTAAPAPPLTSCILLLTNSQLSGQTSGGHVQIQQKVGGAQQTGKFLCCLPVQRESDSLIKAAATILDEKQLPLITISTNPQKIIQQQQAKQIPKENDINIITELDALRATKTTIPQFFTPLRLSGSEKFDGPSPKSKSTGLNPKISAKGARSSTSEIKSENKLSKCTSDSYLQEFTKDCGKSSSGSHSKEINHEQEVPEQMWQTNLLPEDNRDSICLIYESPVEETPPKADIITIGDYDDCLFQGSSSSSVKTQKSTSVSADENLSSKDNESQSQFTPETIDIDDSPMSVADDEKSFSEIDLVETTISSDSNIERVPQPEKNQIKNGDAPISRFSKEQLQFAGMATSKVQGCGPLSKTDQIPCSNVIGPAVFVPNLPKLNDGSGVAQRFLCTICGADFSLKSSLRRHNKIHTRGLPPFSCEVCGKIFATVSSLRRHETSHSSERRFGCKYCKNKFKRVEQLNRHIKCVHNTAPNQYKCKTCSKPYKNEFNLRIHEKQHDGWSHLCKSCGKGFSFKKHLTRHEKIHTKAHATKYKCSFCPTAFSRRDNLNSHLKKAHQTAQLTSPEEHDPPVLATVEVVDEHQIATSSTMSSNYNSSN